MPTDPVCGIEFDEKVASELAIVQKYEGKDYYFCCNGCRRIFLKNLENKKGTSIWTASILKFNFKTPSYRIIFVEFNDM